MAICLNSTCSISTTGNSHLHLGGLKQKQLVFYIKTRNYNGRRSGTSVITCSAGESQTVVICLAADSGCGKSTFMRRLTSVFGGAAEPPKGGNPDSNTLISDTTTVICLDDYHSLDRTGRKEKGVTALDPRANDFDLMFEQVKALKDGVPVEKPIYNHVTGLLDPPELIKPPKILVIEGFHPMYDQRVRDLLDFSIYLDISNEVKFAWKIQRDMAERGHSLESIKASIEARKPDFDAYIDPQKQYVDIVIEMLPTQLISGDNEGKVLRVRLIIKGVKHFSLVNLFDEGSTISWIPCGRKLTCSYPGIKFFYGPDTYFGHKVSVLEMHGQFDRLDEIIYVKSHVSNLSTKFYREVTQQMSKNADFLGSNNKTNLLHTIVGLKIRDLYEQIIASNTKTLGGMIRITVFCETHLMLPPENPPEIPDVSFRVKENESLSLLKKCRNMEDFKQVHAQILKWGFFSNPFVASSLLVTCGLTDWGSMDYACLIFSQIDQPGSFDFNTLIKGHVSDMGMENALLVYYQMLENGIESNNFTYPALFKACAWLKSIEEGMQIHGHVLKLGLQQDLYVQNSLIYMYGKCGKIEASSAVFKHIDYKDSASWSSIIGAHTSSCLWYESLELFQEMIIRDRFCRPEESLLVSVISACSHLGALDFGKFLHGLLLRNMRECNLTVHTSLIEMYIKCGFIEKGFCLFQRMRKKNHFTYSVMISGFAMHNRCREALQVFSEMLDEGFRPDDVIYVGVLSACSQGGFLQKGLEYFNRMKSEHGIQPTIQHYGCLVDLMGRAGKLDEALKFIRNMHIKPNDVVWRSLLAACKTHHNLHIGKIAAKSLLILNSQNPGDWLMLSNIYAKAQRWDDSAMIRKEIAHQKLNQIPGVSLVECNRKVHKFVSQDKSHPQCKEIYDMIHQMEWQLKFEGYIPDTSQILLDVEEEEKRERLKAHSQKLAIAFALINNKSSQGNPIRIFRNVRMCSDCHTYTKFISSIYGREIIVRDRNEFYHFRNGVSSCKDYW